MIDLEREVLFDRNLRFFENGLSGIAARYFFLDAVRCAKPQPAFFLAGVSCLLHGIEGALSYAIHEKQNGNRIREDHPMDRGEHITLNNRAVQLAGSLGFNIEVPAFPEEKGEMRDRARSNDPVGIVLFRNEFSHGKAYRATEKFGSSLISDTFLLALHFKELLELSYDFVMELDRFRGSDFSLERPDNPFDY